MDASYEAALSRNLIELERAQLNLQAMVAMEAAKPTEMSLKVIYYALFNDYIAHCIKVFDQHRDAASFWYLHKQNKQQIEQLADSLSIDLAGFSQMSDKLKHVRDKTHFHIDRKGVIDPKAVWRDAEINGLALAKTVRSVWSLLMAVREANGLDRVDLPELNTSVITKATTMIEEGRIE